VSCPSVPAVCRGMNLISEKRNLIVDYNFWLRFAPPGAKDDVNPSGCI